MGENKDKIEELTIHFVLNRLMAQDNKINDMRSKLKLREGDDIVLDFNNERISELEEEVTKLSEGNNLGSDSSMIIYVIVSFSIVSFILGVLFGKLI